MESDRELSREELALMEGYLLRGDPIPDVANGFPRLFRLAYKGLAADGLVEEVKDTIEMIGHTREQKIKEWLEQALSAYQEVIKEKE